MHEGTPKPILENQQDDDNFATQLAKIAELKEKVREVNQTHRGWTEEEEELYQTQNRTNSQLINAYIRGEIDWQSTLEGYSEITDADLSNLISKLSEVRPGVPILHTADDYRGFQLQHTDGDIEIQGLSLDTGKYTNDYSLYTRVRVRVGTQEEDGNPIVLDKDENFYYIGAPAILEYYANQIALTAAEPTTTSTLSSIYKLKRIRKALDRGNIEIDPNTEALRHNVLMDFVSKAIEGTSSGVDSSDLLGLIDDDENLSKDMELIDKLLLSGDEFLGSYSYTDDLSKLGGIIERAEGSEYPTPPANLPEYDRQEYQDAYSVIRALERRSELLKQQQTE